MAVMTLDADSLEGCFDENVTLLPRFYWAADFIFFYAWSAYERFPLFLSLSIGEAVWGVMETYYSRCPV